MNKMHHVTGNPIEQHARLSAIAGEPVYAEMGRGGAVLHGSCAGLTRVAAHFGFRYSSSSKDSDDPRLYLTAAKMRTVQP